MQQVPPRDSKSPVPTTGKNCCGIPFSFHLSLDDIQLLLRAAEVGVLPPLLRELGAHQLQLGQAASAQDRRRLGLRAAQNVSIRSVAANANGGARPGGVLPSPASMRSGIARLAPAGKAGVSTRSPQPGIKHHVT